VSSRESRTPGGADISAERPTAKVVEPTQADTSNRTGFASPNNEPASDSAAFGGQPQRASSRRPSVTQESGRSALLPAIETSNRWHDWKAVGCAITTDSPAIESRWKVTSSAEWWAPPALSAQAVGIGVRSPLDDVAQIMPDSHTLVALRGELSDPTALPGSVAMLMIVVVGIAIGYRQARQHDAAGVDTIRYMS
jgi:hypothetical protein